MADPEFRSGTGGGYERFSSAGNGKITAPSILERKSVFPHKFFTGKIVPDGV
jgi:hypothetical protein